MSEELPPTPEQPAAPVQPAAPAPVAAPAAPAPVPVAAAPAKKGLAITALVLGIVAILGSWIPFVGIGSAFLGFIGLVFGVIATILAFRGKAGGKVLALVGTGLSFFAIVFAIISTAVGVAVVDDTLDDIEASLEALDPEVSSSAGPVTDTSDDPAEPTVGTLDSPAAIGDGTVWTFSSGGDEWEITFDAVEIVPGYDGDVAVVTGTATPTAIAEGDVSSWTSFPMIGFMADGAVVDDTFDIPETDKFEDYRLSVELEGTVGTEMQFYSTVGLPDGVVPEYMTVEMLFGDETLYFATGL